jgi:hypothetical protein
MKTNVALGIEVNLPIPPGGSLFAKNEQKDCNAKPDPQGNAQKPIKMVENGYEVNKTQWLSRKDNIPLDTLRIFKYFIILEKECRVRD